VRAGNAPEFELSGYRKRRRAEGRERNGEREAELLIFFFCRGRHEEVEELLEHVAMTNTSSLDCLLQGGRIRKVRENSAGQEDWASFLQSVEGLFMRKIRQTTVFLMTTFIVEGRTH
jgi:hypothetical protein